MVNNLVNYITQNSSLILNIFVSTLIITFSFLIFLRIHKFYILSGHKGLKIFSYAFLYFGIAFLFGQTPTYLIDVLFLRNIVSSNFLEIYYFVFGLIFYYILTLAGFSLVYSLIWREFENYKLFNIFLDKLKFIKNPKEIALYFDSLIVTILAIYKQLYWLVIMLIVLVYASFLSYNNYKKLRLEGKKNNFAQFYFYAMILAFLGFGGNFILGFFPNIEVYVDLSMVVIFGIFLWGSYKINK